MAPAIHDGMDNAVVDNSFITQIHVSCICMYRVWKPRAKTLHKGMKCQVPSWTAKFSLSLHLATETHFNLLVVLYPLLGNYCPSRIELCGPVQKAEMMSLSSWQQEQVPKPSYPLGFQVLIYWMGDTHTYPKHGSIMMPTTTAVWYLILNCKPFKVGFRYFKPWDGSLSHRYELWTPWASKF